MPTDFYERQSQAHRSTKWLVWFFLLAVVSIVGLVFFVTATATNAICETYDAGNLRRTDPEARWAIAMSASLATLVLIGGGSVYKIRQLRGGGTSVAENIGGRRVMPNTTDLVERRLVNVVEEMALASGLPVPPIYLLADEEGINAFAAGYSPSDAVVAVTRGTAEQLSRDQLQGVVAHEFSHILNGDMRLNIRLIGVLHGILLMGLLGRVLFRIAGHSGRSRSRNDIAMIFVLVGLLLIVLGLVGTLMGNIIKASVSRQREYLADASAVQFTRNPHGIAGALKRIGAAVFGSRLQHSNAAEISHMYLSQGVWEGFTGLMATHPPLGKRILALEPRWDGKFPALPATPAALTEISQASSLAGDTQIDPHVPFAALKNAGEQVGHPTEIHSTYARQLVEEIPEEVIAAVHEPYGSRAVVFSLLLDRDDEIRGRQMKRLRELTTPDIVALTDRLTPTIDQLDTRLRLPLVDMAMPALRSMVRPQYVEFSQAFQEMVRADDRLSLFEWMLHRVLLRNLQPQFEKTAAPHIAYYGLHRLAAPCTVLLSTLAHAGNTLKEAESAFAEATKHLPEVDLHLSPSTKCSLAKLDHALAQLAAVATKHRQRLIDACAAAICADRKVKVREVELLRGISDMLNCPMPPLLAGQKMPRAPFTTMS
ncbi:MAG: M48 family metallopeptidase [Pirellulales bacterium]|nr:M48 family metallopeptidase [Pirellulales bacterium]